jgi:hypothetical protein
MPKIPKKQSDGATRRRFLGNTLGTLALAPFAGVLPAAAQNNPASATTGESKEILILGAGMSGLTAALSLLRAGHKVKVIEYQNRVGGRLLSVPLKGGQFAEAGGGHLQACPPPSGPSPTSPTTSATRIYSAFAAGTTGCRKRWQKCWATGSFSMHR